MVNQKFGKSRVWLVLYLLIMVMAGCHGGRKTESVRPPISVQVQEVQHKNMTTTLSYSGTIEESAAVALSFSVPGTVERVQVTAGQRVRQGQPLAALNEANYRNILELSQAKLVQAEDALKRFEPMHKNASMSEIKFVELETGVRQARAATAIARKSLDDCRLLAPAEGVIGRRSIEPGMNVLPGIPGVPALVLLQIDSVWVKIPVPENEIARIRQKQPAEIVIPALAEATLHGLVEEIGVQANILSRCYDVKIGLANPEGVIRPGMVCNVMLAFPSPAPMLTVPRTALMDDESGLTFVYVIDDAGRKVSKRLVTIGVLNDEGVCIISGLQDGEKVVVAGTQKLSDGASVTVI
jgi:membrane fusion protein (multidrug efflux system)